MIRFFRFLGFWLSFILLVDCTSLTAEEISSTTIIHHDLRVVINPKEHSFTAEDTVTLPEGFLPEFQFFLHRGLAPSSPTKGVSIAAGRGDDRGGVFEPYKAHLPQGVKTFTIQYGGVINHPLAQHGKEQARGFSLTEGIISEDGVYLAGTSLWYPVSDKAMVTFRLRLELPRGWDAVSQGSRADHVRDEKATRVQWECPEPQEEIFVVAARFHEYTRTEGRIPGMVFLRTPDKGLAAKYLDATAKYLAMYDELIGPYPYEKFALVENFWETGFGMPSFTLLGPKVIRLPFIIDTSYPHEILHNWWGNSVFPDYKKGNWSEGLTAYLSDHLLKEQRGEGREYRLTTLQKYADYVTGGRDFPITGFRSRHSSSSEAIGYGKSLLFFHMLRLELGDGVFLLGLRDFYQKNRFTFASFDDIKESFERVSGRDLNAVFDQWITRTGAPELKVEEVKVTAAGPRHLLSASISQVQQGPAYYLRVPVAVTMEGEDQAYQTIVAMDRRRVDIRVDLASRPLRIDVDPEFDVFRRLGRDEIPPAISLALGAGKMLVILPSSADGPLLQAYREFAGSLSKSGPDEVRTVLDSELSKLPTDQSVAILGRENRFFDQVVSALSLYGTTITGEDVRLGKMEIPLKNHSVVLTARNPENRDLAMMSVVSDPVGALPGLARKLPHYHKYSYLGFEGAEPANIAAGRWPVIDSPLTVQIPGPSGTISKVEMGKVETRKPLIGLPSGFSTERMMETIKFLSSDDLRGRAAGTVEIEVAAEYIAKKFSEAGLKPAGDEDGSYFQTWEERDDSGHRILMKNVVGAISGKTPGRSVVLGAHYDHLGSVKGQVYHGADDNASGIAVLVELAGKLGKNLHPDKAVVFAAFTGEESGKRGSKYYIKGGKRYPSDGIAGMLNLDTVGRLGNRKLLVLGAGSAKEWVHIFRGAGHVAHVEIETVAEDLDSSDQKSFQDAGIPAVQLFAGPHPDYHRPTDTFGKIDTEGLVKVAAVAKEVIEYLADRREPLTATISPEGKVDAGPRKERKVSLGVVPDFAFTGAGCRLSGVSEDSPAEKAGLREGDIVIRINSAVVNGLKDLSDVLKSLEAGTRVSITFLRDGKERSVDVKLEAK